MAETLTSWLDGYSEKFVSWLWLFSCGYVLEPICEQALKPPSDPVYRVIPRALVLGAEIDELGGKMVGKRLVIHEVGI